MFWIAYAIFAEAMARLVQQISKMNDIMNNAKSTANGLKDQWTGDDYNAFDTYVQNDLVPGMNTAIQTLQDWNSRLGRAQDRMRQADNQGKAMVGQLSDVFSKITN